MNTTSSLNLEQFQSVELKDLFFVYQFLARSFYNQWHVKTVLADAAGSDVLGESRYGDALSSDRRSAVMGSVRCGSFCRYESELQPDMIFYAVAVMFNNKVLGGIIMEYNIRTDASVISQESLADAAAFLLDMAKRTNLVNTAFMERNKKNADLQDARLKAIRETEGIAYHDLRDVYLVQEPNLIACIKRGDRAAALEVLDQILTAVYTMAGDRPQVLKSFLLELAVSISRTAMEAGSDGEAIMASNYSTYMVLSRLNDEAELKEWVTKMLDMCIDSLNTNRLSPNSILLSDAIRYMRTHVKDDLFRDDVAALARMSPSHFSRVVKQTFGMTFSELFATFKVDKAKELLLYTNYSLLEVAHESGFNDQSYFTKVFLRYAKETPGHFRRQKLREQQSRLPDASGAVRDADEITK
ncbi:MAG: helix-turn-helix transcriptional regulator [Abditibacteriota bacterium]|nr:helix-turn-helix transcriptional regulator [Abditibacteriota bacterium]